MVNQGIITLAFGSEKYIAMAKSLALSLILHDPKRERAIISDSDDPELDLLFHKRIPYNPQFGSNVRQKLYLDQYTPFQQTLFIDSDCLVTGPLDKVFERCSGKVFTVPGHRTLTSTERDECVDVPFVLNRFGLNSLPKFNGGMYYFEKSSLGDKLFNTAKDILARSTELRLRSFRNDGPSDEIIYGLAMALTGNSMTDFGSTGMFTPINSQGKVHLDVVRGKCSFIKEGRKVNPEIVHFCGEWSDSYVYRRERVRLAAHHSGTEVRMADFARLYAHSHFARGKFLIQCCRRFVNRG